MTNRYLKEAAHQRDWGFIDNANISYRHLSHDGIHLNRSGQAALATNFLSYLYPRSRKPADSIKQDYRKRSCVSPNQTYAEVVQSHHGRDFPERAWKTRMRTPNAPATTHSTQDNRQDNRSYQRPRQPLPSQATEWFKYQQRMSQSGSNPRGRRLKQPNHQIP